MSLESSQKKGSKKIQGKGEQVIFSYAHVNGREIFAVLQKV